MNVIAILSHPQECGDDSLRLVSCFDGQVVLEITLSPDREIWEEVTRVEPLEDEVGIFYDPCVKPRYELYHQSDDFTSGFLSFADRECTKSLWSNLDWYWQVREDSLLTIIDIKNTGELPYRSEEEREFLKGKKVYSWQYTVQRAKLHYDSIYHKEWDSVYKEILQKCGIECPVKDRYDESSLAAKIADAMGYKLLNVIYG